MKAEGLIPKPFVPKKRSFTFPPVEKMGQRVLTIEGEHNCKLLHLQVVAGRCVKHHGSAALSILSFVVSSVHACYFV